MKTTKQKKKKYEKPLKTNMSFGELLARIVRIEPPKKELK